MYISFKWTQDCGLCIKLMLFVLNALLNDPFSSFEALKCLSTLVTLVSEKSNKFRLYAKVFHFCMRLLNAYIIEL